MMWVLWDVYHGYHGIYCPTCWGIGEFLAQKDEFVETGFAEGHLFPLQSFSI